MTSIGIVDEQVASGNGTTVSTAALLDYQMCYESTADERAALAEEEVLDVNVDVPQAVTIASSALTRIAELGPQMAGLSLNHGIVRKVGLYAGALAFVHAMYSIEAKAPEGMQQLYEQLLQTRTLLRLDANNLAARDLINPAALRSLSGETGFHNAAYDVLALVSLHTAASDKSAGRTAVTATELKNARADASLLLNLLAQRQQQLNRSELNEQRRRAFTLLHLAYDEARRATTFLQWREPEKQIPSLHAARGAGRKTQRAPVSGLQQANSLQPAGAGTRQGGAPATDSAPNGVEPGSGSLPASGTPTAGGARGGNPFAAS